MEKHYNDSARAGLLNRLLGVRVDRAAAALPGGTSGAIFTISNGVVLMTAILGEWVGAASGACNLKITANPTLATAVDTDLCAVAAVATCDIGSLLSIDGTPANALLAPHVGAVELQTPTGIFLQEGTLDLDASTTITGNVKWSIWYIPAEEGAIVTAA